MTNRETSLPQPDTAAPVDPDRSRGETVHRFLVQPADAGIVGSVDGGKLLEWIDKAGYAAAALWSGRYCVTAYVGNIHLDRPIAVGELVELHAAVVYTGRTAMHILVTVYSTDPTPPSPSRLAVPDHLRCRRRRRHLRLRSHTGCPRRCCSCNVTARRRARIPMRKQIEAAMAAQQYTAEGTGPHATLRFLASPTDINWGGKVHGGRVMRWIDEAELCLRRPVGRRAGHRLLHRRHSVLPAIVIGHIIEVTARLIHTGHRSIHCSVHVTTSDTNFGATTFAAHALAVFVSLDGEGKAQPMRKWEPTSGEDRRLDQHARDLIGLRAIIEPFTSSTGVPADAEPNCYHLNSTKR